MNKKVLTLIALVLLVVGSEKILEIATRNTPSSLSVNIPQTQIETSFTQNQSFLVLRVVDGDTIVVNINGMPEKIRLIGVNTPETVDLRKKVECFGKEASHFASSVLLGTSVILEADASQGERDRYGRLLRYVFLPDGTLFNKVIIAEGYGHEYTYRVSYRYQNEFKEAEHSAQELKKGLWVQGACE